MVVAVCRTVIIRTRRDCYSNNVMLVRVQSLVQKESRCRVTSSPSYGKILPLLAQTVI